MGCKEAAGSLARLIFEVACPSDDRRFDDSGGYRLAEWKVADDVLEELPFVVFGRRGKVEFRDDPAVLSELPSYARVNEIYGFIPCRIRVPHMVRLIIHHHHATMRGNSLAKRLSSVQGFCL